MPEETRLGKIQISPVAVATIASQAVLECYGVVGISSRGLAEVLHRSHRHRGVEVRFLDGESTEKPVISIDIYLIIEYGVRIVTVANNVMSSVGFAVEQALGVPVQQVNVHVQGLRVSDADEPAG
jgi:uncharacterized alkaline shock family protein YloU